LAATTRPSVEERSLPPPPVNFNIALGSTAGQLLTTGDNNIYIGNDDAGGGGFYSESDTIRIGSPNGVLLTAHTRTFIAGIYGVQLNITGGPFHLTNFPVPVMISTSGQLGTTSSSRRFKKEIKPMAQASEAILNLKPVTFHYKSDETGTPQFGLVAEDVAEVNPDLVVCDDKGEIYTVRYDAVNVMLLNEFLKEHGKVQKLEAAAAQQ
jgi:hypothetical protein